MEHSNFRSGPCRRPNAIAASLPAKQAADRATLLRWLLVLSSLALLAADAAPAKAAIHDNANIFSPEAEQRAAQRISEIRQKFGKDLLIESHPSVRPTVRPSTSRRATASSWTGPPNGPKPRASTAWRSSW